LLTAAFFLNAYGQVGKVIAGNGRLIALAGWIGFRIFPKKRRVYIRLEDTQDYG